MDKKIIYAFLSLLFLGLIFLGYQHYVLENQTVVNTNPASQTESPTQVTQKFYDDFTSCDSNPPPQAEGMVGNYCQANTGLTSKKFASNIQSSPMAESTTCSQNPPISITATDEKIEDDKAYVDVNEDFGEIKQTIQVSLVLENGSWKVDNIICPKI